MHNLLEKIALFSTSTEFVTIACVAVGTVIVYYVLFGNHKNNLSAVKSTTVSREINRDIHTQNKTTVTHDDEMHTESEKALRREQTEETVKASKPEPRLAVLTDKPALVENNLKENEKRQEMDNVKQATASASDSTCTLDAIANAVKSKVPEPVLAAFEATTAATVLEAQNFVAAMPKVPKPFLAAFEATTAATVLEAQNFVAAMPKVPKPFLAAFEATTAATALEAQIFVAAMPKIPKPFLAAFEATTATTALEAQNFVAAMPKVPRPFLAAFEATTATTALEAQNFVAAMPKVPKPFLAAYEATTASTSLTSSEYIAALPKAPKPSFAVFEAPSLKPQQSVSAYEATTAHFTDTAQKHVASLVLAEDYMSALKAYQEKQIASLRQTPGSLCSDKLTHYELTTASAISPSRAFINDFTSLDGRLNALEPITSKFSSVETPCTIATNPLTCLEAPTSYRFSHEQQQQEQQHQHHAEFDSDIEVEIEDNVLSSPSVSSTTTLSETGASRGMITPKRLQIDTTENNTSPFIVSWDQMYAGSSSSNNRKPVVVESPKSAAPFMSTVDCTYYPNCTNKKCKFVHPGLDNNPKLKRAATMDGGSKKSLTTAERIQHQSQRHLPTWKSRCVHWPFCTNNHCKYSHPTRECRMGDQCTFMERCMFLHPSDFMEPAKKQHAFKKAEDLPHLQSEQLQSLTQV